MKIRFPDIEIHVPPRAGLYEIHTDEGVALKVGIGVNLLKRLKSHRASRDSGLRWRDGCDHSNPDDVTSKSSILAKHLFFDTALTSEFDLKTEAGRRRFLADLCYVQVRAMTIEDATLAEKQMERSERFRYLGYVRIR